MQVYFGYANIEDPTNKHILYSFISEILMEQNDSDICNNPHHYESNSPPSTFNHYPTYQSNLFSKHFLYFT